MSDSSIRSAAAKKLEIARKFNSRRAASQKEKEKPILSSPQKQTPIEDNPSPVKDVIPYDLYDAVACVGPGVFDVTAGMRGSLDSDNTFGLSDLVETNVTIDIQNELKRTKQHMGILKLHSAGRGNGITNSRAEAVTGVGGEQQITTSATAPTPTQQRQLVSVQDEKTSPRKVPVTSRLQRRVRLAEDPSQGGAQDDHDDGGDRNNNELRQAPVTTRQNASAGADPEFKPKLPPQPQITTQMRREAQSVVDTIPRSGLTLQCTIRSAGNERVPTKNTLVDPSLPAPRPANPNKAEFLRKNRVEVEASSAARAQEEAATATGMTRDLSGLLHSLAAKEKSLITDGHGHGQGHNQKGDSKPTASGAASSALRSGRTPPTAAAMETSRNTLSNSKSTTPPRDNSGSHMGNSSTSLGSNHINSMSAWSARKKCDKDENSSDDNDDDDKEEEAARERREERAQQAALERLRMRKLQLQLPHQSPATAGLKRDPGLTLGLGSAGLGQGGVVLPLRPQSSPNMRSSQESMYYKEDEGEGEGERSSSSNKLPSIGLLNDGCSSSNNTLSSGNIPSLPNIPPYGGSGSTASDSRSRPRSTGALFTAGIGTANTHTNATAVGSKPYPQTSSQPASSSAISAHGHAAYSTASYLKHTVRTQLEKQIHDTYKNKINELTRQLENVQRAKGGVGLGKGRIKGKGYGKDDDTDAKSDILSMIQDEDAEAGFGVGADADVVKLVKRKKRKGKKKKNKDLCTADTEVPGDHCKNDNNDEDDGGNGDRNNSRKAQAVPVTGYCPAPAERMVATVASVTAEVNRRHPLLTPTDPTDCSNSDYATSRLLASSGAQNASLSNEDWLNQFMRVRRSQSQGMNSAGGVNMGVSRPEDRDQQSLYYNHHQAAAAGEAQQSYTAAGVSALNTLVDSAAKPKSSSGTKTGSSGRYSAQQQSKVTSNSSNGNKIRERKPAELMRVLDVGGTSIGLRQGPAVGSAGVSARVNSSSSSTPLTTARTSSKNKDKQERRSEKFSDIPTELILPDFAVSSQQQQQQQEEEKSPVDTVTDIVDSSTDDLIYDLNSSRQTGVGDVRTATGTDSGGVVTDIGSSTTNNINHNKEQTPLFQQKQHQPQQLPQQEYMYKSLTGSEFACPKGTTTDYLGRVICGPHGITECSLCELRNQTHHYTITSTTSATNTTSTADRSRLTATTTATNTATIPTTTATTVAAPTGAGVNISVRAPVQSTTTTAGAVSQAAEALKSVLSPPRIQVSASPRGASGVSAATTGINGSPGGVNLHALGYVSPSTTASTTAANSTGSCNHISPPHSPPSHANFSTPSSSIRVILSPRARDCDGIAGESGESPIRIDMQNSYMQHRHQRRDKKVDADTVVLTSNVAAVGGGGGGASIPSTSDITRLITDNNHNNNDNCSNNDILSQFKGYSPGRDRALLTANYSSLSPPRKAANSSSSSSNSSLIASPGGTGLGLGSLLIDGSTTVSSSSPPRPAGGGNNTTPMSPPNPLSLQEPLSLSQQQSEAPLTLNFFDATSTADKGRYIVNSARGYQTNSITRKPDIPGAGGGAATDSASPGIILLCGRQKETNKEHILTVLFDRTVYITEEAAATWWELNKTRLLRTYR